MPNKDKPFTECAKDCEIVNLYSIDILKTMFLTSYNYWSTYGEHNGFSLYDLIVNVKYDVYYPDGDFKCRVNTYNDAEMASIGFQVRI